MKDSWQPRPLKYYLSSNDGGVWGENPDGINDTIVLRSTDIALDGTWNLQDPATRAITPAEQREKQLCEQDLVVVKSSGSAQHLGKTALVTRPIAEINA